MPCILSEIWIIFYNFFLPFLVQSPGPDHTIDDSIRAHRANCICGLKKKVAQVTGVCFDIATCHNLWYSPIVAWLKGPVSWFSLWSVKKCFSQTECLATYVFFCFHIIGSYLLLWALLIVIHWASQVDGHNQPNQLRPNTTKYKHKWGVFWKQGSNFRGKKGPEKRYYLFRDNRTISSLFPPFSYLKLHSKHYFGQSWSYGS